ncbi:MAG: glycosyltransferase family 4 protein [Nostoc desertorum CM1-VF14]|nr:glycosyltransferase family 4 protein [Nostoc desertorum CM1-VF14]
MRVMIVRRVPGSTFSLEVYADNLIAELRKVRPNWEIAEIAPIPWNSPDKLYLSGLGIKKYYETFWRHPLAVSRLEADIFHVIDQSDAHIAYGLHRANKPVVVTCHDLVQFIYPEILRDQSRLPALSMAMWKYSVGGMEKADHVITVSRNTAKDVNRILNIKPEQITVAPNGINPEFRVLPDAEVAKIREQCQRSPDTFCLLNVGSTHQRKNILTVLRVLKNLKEQGFPICLWRTGGNFTQEQKAFIREHHLELDICDFGNPDKAKLVQIYNAADVLLAPSLYEGFGLTVLEAMACGTPVITSNVSSLPEVVGDAGIMIDPNCPQAIADAVIELYKNATLYKSSIEKGLARAKLFSWQNTAEQVATVYEKILHL